MSILLGFLIVIEVICALLLVLLVLLQRSKDEGLGMAFGNAMGESLFGAQAATILTKGTIYLAVVFMLNTIMIDRLYSRHATRSSSAIMERLDEPVAAPLEPTAVPGVPAAEAPAPVEAPAAPAAPASEVPAAPAPAAPAPAAPETPAAPAPQA